MPEVRFQIEWPDGVQETCYSPSLVVKDYFEPGVAYSLTDFLVKSQTALTIASDRVAAKYGFPCGQALGQLQQIEAKVQHYQQRTPASTVKLIQFLP